MKKPWCTDSEIRCRGFYWHGPLAVATLAKSRLEMNSLTSRPSICDDNSHHLLLVCRCARTYVPV